MTQAITATPVGTWKGTTVMPDMTFEVEFKFTEDGKALLSTTEGSEGKGTWTSTGDSTFNFQIIEYVAWGRIRISQDGIIDGDSFTASGTSKVYDTNGVFLKSVNPTVTATKVSS